MLFVSGSLLVESDHFRSGCSCVEDLLTVLHGQAVVSPPSGEQ